MGCATPVISAAAVNAAITSGTAVSVGAHLFNLVVLSALCEGGEDVLVLNMLLPKGSMLTFHNQSLFFTKMSWILVVICLTLYRCMNRSKHSSCRAVISVSIYYLLTS